MKTNVFDALGRHVAAPARPERIISLVPSLTELLFSLGCGDRVAGVSNYCTHPQAGLALVPRVGGQKDPDLKLLLGLGPELVLANKEENLKKDVERLEAAGVPVYVTDVRSIEAAVALPAEIGALCAADPEVIRALDAQIREGVEHARQAASHRAPVEVLVPVWRDPWIVAGADTYIDAVLGLLGATNQAASRPRYPKLGDLSALGALGARLVLLPSEPYPFTEADAAQVSAALGVPAVLCDGTVLCWYGPRTARLAELLSSLYI